MANATLCQKWGPLKQVAANGPGTPEATDYGLARLAAGGDAGAFERLFFRHSRRVYSVCLRMLGNVADAEDITQEVFIQLYRHVGGFRGQSAFTTWLHRMAVNQVLMHLRRKKVRAERVTADGEPPSQVAPGSENPRAMQVVDRVALERAITELPPGYRAVFVLHDVEGREHEEIARMLGCAIGTSKSQLHKARRRLRQLLSRRSGV